MDTQTHEPEIDGKEVDSTSLVATIDKAALDVQIATAKRWPRSIDKFRKDMLALATADEQIARTMFYVVPRAGKNIEGPSVRLAEIAGSCWGNIRYQARIVSEDERFITAQGMCFDLERNIAISVEIRRRITDRSNRRYTDDMVQTTGNAAMSIALRNAIFRVVPGALIKPVMEESKKVSAGKGQTMEQRRKNALQTFRELGAKDAEVLRLLKRRGVPDITIDDLILLNGLRTAIEEGTTTWESVLADLPRTDEEVERSLKTGFEDIDIAADRKKKGETVSPERGSNAHNIPPQGAGPVSPDDADGGDEAEGRGEALETGGSEDASQPSAPRGDAPADDDEKAMAADLFNACKLSYPDKVKLLKAKVKGFNGIPNLRKDQLEPFAAALQNP